VAILPGKRVYLEACLTNLLGPDWRRLLWEYRNAIATAEWLEDNTVA
jgi:hypothetical protein